MMRVLDPDTGEESPATWSLGTHREVEIHQEVLRRQEYTNVSGDELAFRTSPSHVATVRPGERIRYTGVPKPSLSQDSRWKHESYDLVIETVN